MSSFAKDVNKLLIAIKKGDKSAFKALYNLIANHVRGVARYYLVDKTYSEDVVVETFQKIYLYINSYKEGKDGYNWICKTTQNIAINYNTKFLANVSTETITNHGTDEYEKNSEEKIDLFRAIDRLHPENREIIYKYYFLDKTMQEIAIEHHLSKSGVKKRIDKILKQLKVFIESGKR